MKFSITYMIGNEGKVNCGLTSYARVNVKSLLRLHFSDHYKLPD